MTTNKFGTNIPQSELEEIELYNMFGIDFVAMRDTFGQQIEVATYSVVKRLLEGWNLEPANCLTSTLRGDQRKLLDEEDDWENIPF